MLFVPRSDYMGVAFILKKEVRTMKIGTYFDDYEFACKCGRHGYDSDGYPILDHIIDKNIFYVRFL